MRKLIITALLFAGAAYAQTATEDIIPPPPPPPLPPEELTPPAPTVIVPVPVPAAPVEREYHYIAPERAPIILPVERKPLGLGVKVGGGVTQYFADEANRAANIGPDWNARLTVGTRSWVGGEAAYVGSTQQINGLAPNLRGPQLLGNGVEGLARVNFTRDLAVQPYIGAGLGYKHFNVINTGPSTVFSDVTDETNLGYVPTTAGVGYRTNGMLFDGRFGVDIPFTRPAVNTVRSNAAATSWNLNANVGWEF